MVLICPRKTSRKKTWVAAVFLGVFVLSGATGSLWAEEEGKGSEKNNEKEQAMLKSVLAAKIKHAKGSAAVSSEQGPSSSEGTGKEGLTKEEEEVKAEEPPFFIAENIRWEGNVERAVLEIVGEEKTLPEGALDADARGLSLRWRPAKPLVVKEKKDNPVDESLIQRVLFRENTALTKKLELEAPYYALDEIVMIFSDPVSYNVTKEGNWLSIEATPVKAEETEDEEVQEIRKAPEIPMPEATSPADILGNFFEAKELYEAYIMGGGRGMESLFKRAREGKKVSSGFFDGTQGFPEEMAPIFKDAYPAFGTKEYWKKHVRAVARQTFGYSSDFDGTYGSWGGSSVKDPAFTMQPDIDVMYNGLGFGRPFYGSRKPTGTLDLGYKGGKIFPVAKQLGFGDGLRSQTINWGGNYRPNKRYALSTQNTLRLFGGKTLQKKRSGELYREFRRGYRMTNAAGLNYRLTKRILWTNGVGMERTLSDANDGRSRDSTGFLSSGIEQVLSKKLRLDTNYSYRHLFFDKDPYRNPSPYTKGKDIHSLSTDLRYKISNKWFLNGGPDLNLVDGDIFKFGGRAKLKYQWRPQDEIRLDYENALIQNGSGKILGGLTSRNANASSITLSRFEITRVTYWHALSGGNNPKTKLAFSFEYRRNLPMSGIYGQQDTNDDGFNAQASCIRKLRGGLTWLELTYRFSTYRSEGTDSVNTTDISIKEHAVFFVIRNYFGEWGEMT